MDFTYCKCTAHFRGSSRIRSSIMMLENGTDDCNVVDQVSLPWRPEFDFARNLVVLAILLRYECSCAFVILKVRASEGVVCLTEVRPRRLKR